MRPDKQQTIEEIVNTLNKMKLPEVDLFLDIIMVYRKNIKLIIEDNK